MTASCMADADRKQIVREQRQERREVERSDWVNTQLILLIFQMECDASTQRALNLDDYETAQTFREKRAMVHHYSLLDRFDDAC
jgi:hypothetical protein